MVPTRERPARRLECADARKVIEPLGLVRLAWKKPIKHAERQSSLISRCASSIAERCCNVTCVISRNAARPTFALRATARLGPEPSHGLPTGAHVLVGKRERRLARPGARSKGCTIHFSGIAA